MTNGRLTLGTWLIAVALSFLAACGEGVLRQPGQADASAADPWGPGSPDARPFDDAGTGSADGRARVDAGTAPDPDATQRQDLGPVPCPDGYQRRGGDCVDIDECASDPCDTDERCTNTEGSYRCTAEPPADCTGWDNNTDSPCAAGTYNCDCSGGCGAQSPCSPPPTGWPPSDYIEIGNYHGRTNGDRPTWYFSKTMSAYPGSFTVVVHQCLTLEVTSNNGHRFEANGVIVKQSDVAGRGMAVVAPSSCQSEKCYIE